MWNKKEMSQLDATLTFTFDLFQLHMVDLWVWETFLTPISVTLGQGH